MLSFPRAYALTIAVALAALIPTLAWAKFAGLPGLTQLGDDEAGGQVAIDAEHIEFDQKMRPRARSQSHRPQRPRFSAVSMRVRTVS